MKRVRYFASAMIIFSLLFLTNYCFADQVTYFEDIGRYSVAVAGNNNAYRGTAENTGVELIESYPDDWDSIKQNIPDEILGRINNMSGSYLDFEGVLEKAWITTMYYGTSNNYAGDILIIKPDGTYIYLEDSTLITIEIDITDSGWYYVSLLDAPVVPQHAWAITAIYENENLSLRYMKFVYVNSGTIKNGASVEVYYNSKFELKDEFEIFGVISGAGRSAWPIEGQTEDTFEAILSDGTYQQLYEDTYNETTIFKGRTSTDFANNIYDTIRSHDIDGGEMDVWDEILGSDYFGGKKVVGYRFTKIGSNGYQPQLVGLAQEIYSPEMEITTTITDVNNDNVLEEGDTVHTTVTVTNVATDAEEIGYNSTITSTVDSVLSDVTNIVVTFNGVAYTSATYNSATNTVTLSGIDNIEPDDVIVIEYDATVNSTISTKGKSGTEVSIDTEATVITYPIDILSLDEDEQEQYADLYLEETDDDDVSGIYEIATSVIVKYVDKYTNKEIATQTTIEGYVDDNYTATAKEISGYVLYSTEDEVTGTMTEDTITITFYYVKQSDVTVKYVDYYDQDTEVATSETDTYSQGNTYTTEQKTISGYTYYTDTGNTSGTVEDENIEVVYYYKKNTSVVAYYIDKYTGETIASTVTISGVQGTSYETEQKTVTGYVYDSVEGIISGTMSADSSIVTYYYVKQSDVTVKYVDYYTREEIEIGQSQTYSQGDTYDTKQKTISGYTFYTDTGNTSGTVEDEDIEVVYYYKKQSSVTVKYVDYYNQDTEIATGESNTYLQGTAYTTEQKAVEGYTYCTDTDNTSGTVGSEDIEVIYYYKKQSNLITEHIDANSGEKIIDDVVKTYNEKDTWESYAQNFEGYVLVESPDVTTGTMEREDITKTYYYKKISAGLVVKYVDVITGELLDQETYEGNEKDTITLDEKTFKNYVIYSRPDYTTVDLTVEAQEVIYYYIRIADIDIMGIDKDTGETLYETSKSGLEGDEYTTTPRNIEGYELVTIPDNQNGTLYRDSDPVIYEYRRVSSGVTVKYIDKDTGKELADTVTISGLYGDSYETDEKEIEDYELVEVVGDTSGTLEVEEKEVIYYYEKKTGQVLVRYEDIDGNELDSEEMSDKVGEDYETEAKEIEGYKLVETPDNATGTYIDGTIEVTYVYKKLGTIIVKFVDSDGNEIAESITTENVVGEEYYLEAPEIDGYTIIGDTYISTAYIDGELVYIIEYEKVEETVDTSDIQVVALFIIFISSIIMSVAYTLKIKKEQI